jgi:hypothetical protein
MKNDIKGKADVTWTGNRPIKLKNWEEFLKLLDAESNPPLSCAPDKYIICPN